MATGFVSWDGTAIAWKDTTAVLEPATLLVIGVILAGIGFVWRKRR